jgi:hypothetical protein
METPMLEIKPKIGLGTLKFGTTMKEVEKHFGLPEEVEKLEAEGEYRTTIWHYWDKGFSLFFDEEEKNNFTCVEIDNEDAHLWGKKVFSMKEEEILNLFKSKGFTEIDTEDNASGEKRVSFDDAVVDMYFEDGELTSINYGVFPEDEKILILPN